MSRTIKRVPLNFTWPMDKTWEGYEEPESLHGHPCRSCNASGQTHFGWWLQNFSYVMGMLADDVGYQEQGKRIHPWLVEFPRHHGHWEYPVQDDPHSGPGRFVIDRPSPDAREFFAKLTGKDPGGHSRDHHYAVMLKLLEITGMDASCPDCAGKGSTEKYPGQRAEAEAWEPSEPPQGEGWQLWETVSSGSPISPVFATADDLAGWMSDPDRGSDWVPTATAAAFIAAGWAPSGISTPETGMVSGVEFIGHHSPSA